MVETNHREREQFQKYQQRVAEKYWKERQINEKKQSNSRYSSPLSIDLFSSIDHHRSYVCCECQRVGTQIEHHQSTFL